MVEKFIPVDPYSLPTAVAKEFWFRSSKGGKSWLTPAEFPLLYAANHLNGATYVAHHEKPASVLNNGQTELDIYIADVNEAERLVGRGEVRYLHDSERPFHQKKPFVSWTETTDHMQGSGLGRRRLIIMNAASIIINGLPLNSGTIFSHSAAEEIWKRLARENAVVDYTELDTIIKGGLKRYRFIEDLLEF